MKMRIADLRHGVLSEIGIVEYYVSNPVRAWLGLKQLLRDEQSRRCKEVAWRVGEVHGHHPDAASEEVSERASGGLRTARGPE
jgi:hypothetical protein